MKRFTFGLATLGALALVALFAFGCSKNSTKAGMSAETAMASVESLAGNPTVSGLMSGLGLNPTQAVGGTGALLGLAEETLAKADWSKIASGIPGASSLISQAKSLGGITGKFSSLANLAPAFSKMGLNADQVKALVPAVTDQVTKAAGSDIGAKFAAAMK
jgi:hypothetical protein